MTVGIWGEGTCMADADVAVAVYRVLDSDDRRHLYAAMVVAGGVMLGLTLPQPLWFDESLTRTRAVEGLHEVMEGNGYGYFAVLRVWVLTFGSSLRLYDCPR